MEGKTQETTTETARVKDLGKEIGIGIGSGPGAGVLS